MKRPIDCDLFQDQLDALLEGRPPEAGVQQLQDHAASCPDCAVLLRMHEQLTSGKLDDLEAAVPAALLESVWPRVRAEITASKTAARGARVPWRGWNLVMPGLAAATLLLSVGVGLLYSEVAQLRHRESVLVQEIAQQNRRLAELVTGSVTDPVTRTALLAGRTQWERMLERRNSVSVAELQTMLRRMPAEATMLEAGAAAALARSVPFWSATTAQAAVAQIDRRDGIQVGELLQIIAVLGIDPERRIPTARILALSRGEA